MLLRLATRASGLARAQAELAAAALIAADPDVRVETVPIVSAGDRQTGSLAGAGGKELFVHALHDALATGQADAACHSLKDVGPDRDGYALAGFLPRACAQDALLGATLAQLQGMRAPRIGTSSPRRTGLLRALVPHAQIAAVRGNVPTRIGRLDAGVLDAIVLAAAGLERLGLAQRITELLPADSFVPAPGQGIIALECRSEREDVARLLASASDGPAASAAQAERAAAATVAGDCTTPLGAYATVSASEVAVACVLAAPDGSAAARGAAAASDAAAAGRQAAARMLADGGAKILQDLQAC